MSVEPQFEQFLLRQPLPRGWLAAEPSARASLWFGIALALLAALPVLVATYPQMVDYPAHLARYHVMLERSHSELLQRYYEFEWKWTGNLGADLLVRPLAALFGLERAGWLICAMVPLLCALGVIAAEWSVRGRIGLGAVLALSFVWSPSLLLGFLNFGLALAVALFAFALWVRLEGKGWRPALFMPIGMAVWLCHVSGWGVLGIMVFGHAWSRDKSWRAFVAPWPLMLPFVALLYGGGTKGDATYGPSPLVWKWAIWKQAMRSSVQWFDYAGVIAVGALVLGSAALRRIDGRLGWAALILLAGSLAMPRHIFGGDFADARLISTGLLVACLALAWRAPRWVLLAAAALFVGRTGLIAQDWHAGSAQTARLLSALEQMPQGARIANLVVTERGVWGYNAQEHIGGYAVVRKDALINAHFAVPQIHMLRLREGGENFRDPSQRLLHRAGEPIDLADWPQAKAADWFWYVGAQQPVRLPAGATQTWHAPGTIVARLAKRGAFQE